MIQSNVNKFGNDVFYHCNELKIIEVGKNVDDQLIDKLLIKDDQNIILMIHSNL